MGKVLHITDAYFKLPEDFEGTLSDALFLFYRARAKSEQLSEITTEKNVDVDKFNELQNKTYSVSFEFIELDNWLFGKIML